MTYLRQVKPELVRLRERVEELQERNKALLRADELMQVTKSGGNQVRILVLTMNCTTELKLHIKLAF